MTDAVGVELGSRFRLGGAQGISNDTMSLL